MWIKYTVVLMMVFLFAVHASSLGAQDVTETPETVAVAIPIAANKGPEDALNRGTPRGSAVGFLEAAAKFDFEKASQYLDVRNLPAEISDIGGHELARQLNHVISRNVWLDDYRISDSPEGEKGDGLPGYRDQLVVIKTKDGKEHPIWLQRVPRADGEQIWKISNRSVALVPELYDEFSYPEQVEKIRKWFPEDASFLGLEAFKWFIMVTIVLLCWPILWLVGWALSRVFSSPKRETYPLVKKAFTGPLVFIGLVAIAGLVIQKLGAGAYAQSVMQAKTLVVIAVIWMLWSFISLFRARHQAKLIANNRPGAAKLLQPMSTLLKIIVVLFGLLFWLNNVGINITTVLAGLGVGGLAMALALQKPIEDMMGALSIFSQAPFRVGDLVKYRQILGMVEDIGLRTTRLRTLTNTIVCCPNAQIAYEEVENISTRQKIRYWPTLRLRYDSSPDQLEKVRDGIVELLKNHPKVHDDPVRVRFTDFDRDAVLLKVHSFVATTEFTEFLEISEQLNLGIMKVVAAEGARFALPGATVQIEGRGSLVSA
jgi:MscS family membrane protein